MFARDPNRALARVLAGGSFSGYNTCAAVAAKYGQVQLKNPSAAKRLLVRGIFMNTNGAAATRCGLKVGTTSLTDASPLVPASLVAGGTASVGEVRQESNSTPVAGTWLGFHWMPASTGIFMPFDRPIVLTQNKYLTLHCDTVNIYLEGIFLFDEEAA